MKTIFDIGMFDGADTRYYLDSGFRVVAVEANPDLVRRATTRFDQQIASGQLVCINAAISAKGAEVELTLSGHDLGSSSIYRDEVALRGPVGAVRVQGITLSELLKAFGLPFYMKIDIEGADRLCVLSLTSEQRPPFLSFEMGKDADELLNHLEAIGYQKFKVINQVSFLELTNQSSFVERCLRALTEQLRPLYGSPVWRGRRAFMRGHSSGPLPWRSDGRWYSGSEVRKRLESARASSSLRDWYDIHART